MRKAVVLLLALALSVVPSIPAAAITPPAGEIQQIAGTLERDFEAPYGIAFIDGDLYVTDKVRHTIRQVAPDTGAVSTFAGYPQNEGGTYLGHGGGTGELSWFSGPEGITSDGTYLYVVEQHVHNIRRIHMATGEVTHFAGFGDGSADGPGATAQFLSPMGITTDGTYLYVADTLNHTIRRVSIATAEVTTLAGSPGESGLVDDVGSAARFFRPVGLVIDGGTLYIADSANDVIRALNLATAEVATLAGGAIGYSDGTGADAGFADPYGMALLDGALYVTDRAASTIRRITVPDGVVTTVAGAPGNSGSADGIGPDAQFASPRGITTDGTSLWIADSANATIRQLNPSNSTVTTLAGTVYRYTEEDGTGEAAVFYRSRAITAYGGTIYTGGSHRVRAITPGGVVATLAGGDQPGAVDDTGADARFNVIQGLVSDGTNLYVADAGNHTIRQVAIATGAASTIAGSAEDIGSADGTGAAARFFFPQGLATDGTHLYVADNQNRTIRKVVLATGEVTTIAGVAGEFGLTDGVGAAARFRGPNALMLDGNDLYIADSGVLRVLDVTSNEVVTLVDSHPEIDDGPQDGPSGTTVLGALQAMAKIGDYLFVADTTYSLIRRISLTNRTVFTLTSTPASETRLSYSPTPAAMTAVSQGDLQGITTDGTALYILFGEGVAAMSLPPQTAPGAPTDPQAGPDDGEVTVTWMPPLNDGGTPITSFRVVTDDGETHADVTTPDGLTYTATVTGLTNGVQYSFTVIATNDEGDSTASAPVTATPDGPLPKPPSPETSTIEADPTSITADGASTSTVTVTLRDAEDDPLGAGGNTVTLSTSAGSLSAVTDHGDGTYTSTLTASTSAGIATITGAIDGHPITDNATVAFTAGAPSSSGSTLTVDPSTINANGVAASAITVVVRDEFGNAIGEGGDTVTLFTTAGDLSTVTDNGDGTYTATLTAGSSPATATITGTLNGDALDADASVEFVGPAPAVGTTQVTAAPLSATANGETEITISVELRDSDDVPLASGGHTVTVGTTRGTSSAVTDRGDGTYEATLTSTSAGPATITATVDGSPIVDTATATFTPGPASPATTLMAASPTSIIANGTSTSTVTITIRDAHANALTGGGADVVLQTTGGTLSAVTDNGNGTYTATLTSAGTAGTATITGTLDGAHVAATATVTFTSPGSPGGNDPIPAPGSTPDPTPPPAPEKQATREVEPPRNPERPAVVEVSLPAGEVSISLNGLTGAAQVTVTQRDEPPVDSGFVLLGNGFDIDLDGAQFASAEICFPYDPAAARSQGVLESEIQIFHVNADGEPENVTSRVDTVNNLVCGVTSSFSPFALGVEQVSRLAGPDRVSTAAAISASRFEPGVPVVFVSTADAFPDSLAGGAAAARLRGPLLLSTGEALPEATTAELRRLRPGRIVVLGGRQAVPDAVAEQLAGLTSGTVERWSGGDRFATAAEIARRTFTNGVDTVYVATGENFPDALAGGAAAAARRSAVLLVATDELPPSTAEELRRLAPRRIVVLGGTAAVSAPVLAELADYATGEVVRVSGADRYATAAAISSASFEAGSVPVVFLATGSNFADALAGVPAAALSRAPVLLVEQDGIPEATRAELRRLGSPRVVVLGSFGVVSQNVEGEARSVVG